MAGEVEKGGGRRARPERSVVLRLVQVRSKTDESRRSKCDGVLGFEHLVREDCGGSRQGCGLESRSGGQGPLNHTGIRIIQNKGHVLLIATLPTA